MNGTIILGVLVSLMFLVGFSQWFYVLALSMNEVIERDIFFRTRVFKWLGGSILFMFLMFWVIAYLSECRRPEQISGIFRILDCRPYTKIRTALEESGLVAPVEEVIEEANDAF
ncbi:hypothetical protein A2368_00690 [Candidatus Collierbacteria bacterium RIFOXYB1_FULL_49_13]|uniref:Uncharacterized protein n=1 Tax=Candidatus Collierbacteria bacterium RIFOXYB1_FULL_49_13 TaxID=1817728 RepID=A0A1F5FHC3_9BACT|nr:MAG: hypothetical protein A2368_00690 [Candidatus Collierbacteria bacterium RIFOXYB1_FULL_49_13]